MWIYFSELLRDREYLIRVQALTVNGSGPASSWLSERTFAHDRDGKYLNKYLKTDSLQNIKFLLIWIIFFAVILYLRLV